MFGAYAAGYGGTYASLERPQGSRYGAVGGREGPRGGRSVGADLCSGQTAGLTDWPIERIAQTVEPNDAQRAVLDELKAATAQALDILKAACPTALPSTPTGRIEAMHQRLDAMLQAVRSVRPVIEKFYQSLNDEQKARFSALGPEDNPDQQQAQRNLTQVCGERASGIASLPLERIERAVRPDGTQRSALKELQGATSEAVNLLSSDCPTYRALTPVGRLQAMEQRFGWIRFGPRRLDVDRPRPSKPCPRSRQRKRHRTCNGHPRCNRRLRLGSALLLQPGQLESPLFLQLEHDLGHRSVCGDRDRWRWFPSLQLRANYRVWTWLDDWVQGAHMGLQRAPT
jgi:LTXXQ motif family protein